MKKTLFVLALLFPFFGFSQGTWTKQSSGITTHLLGVYAINQTTAFTVGSAGKMLKTTDGGKNWASVTSGAKTDLYNIHFTDAKNGYATGNEAVKTTDSGKTWTKMNITSINGVLLRDMFWYSKTVGYVGGTTNSSVGYLFKTIDGGTTWNQEKIPSSKGIYGIAFTDANTGYLSTYGGAILKTTDGGKNWTTKTITSKILSRIYAYDSKTLLVSGRDGALFVTSDSGNTWTSRNKGAETLSHLVMIGGGNGVVIGGNIANNTGIILNTSDSGKTWKSYDPKTSRLMATHFYSVYLGYAVGLDGSILKYTDNTLGVEEVEKSKINITLYPNPAKETVSLEIESKLGLKNIEIRILDAQGRLVKKESKIFHSELIIDINSLSTGNYFITISDGSSVLDTKRFVVAR